MILPPINFQKWIEEHRHLLRPPVGNQVVYTDTNFIVMVVGGPNKRTDYHVNTGEEFFYQLEGNILLRLRDEKGMLQEVPMKAGDIFLLPPLVPHSPQRSEGSVGLVIETKRKADELDGFQWYCPQCEKKLYEEFLHISDIVRQLPEVFARYESKIEHKICPSCSL